MIFDQYIHSHRELLKNLKRAANRRRSIISVPRTSHVGCCNAPFPFLFRYQQHSLEGKRQLSWQFEVGGHKFYIETLYIIYDLQLSGRDYSGKFTFTG